MKTCAMPGCNNPVGNKTLGETKCFKGFCPTEGREVIRCWKETIEHQEYCHYHQQIFNGHCLPAILTAYSPELQQRILVANKKFNQQFRK